MSKRLLPDVNYWIALAFRSHLHHASAVAWIDSLANDKCFFCRMTQQGFLRLANNPSALPNDAVSMTGAWQLYETALNDARIAFANEPPALESVWRQFTQGQQFAPKLWNDAYLAAFALTGGYEVVTFDQGFAQFPGVAVTLLP